MVGQILGHPQRRHAAVTFSRLMIVGSMKRGMSERGHSTDSQGAREVMERERNDRIVACRYFEHLGMEEWRMMMSQEGARFEWSMLTFMHEGY